ncbi:MAG: hypothetical protein ACE367_00635 [Acidimicrobiales bacterium]
MTRREQPTGRFFPYHCDRRFLPAWAPFGVRPGKDGVWLTDDDRFVATYGLLRLETTLDNVVGGHVTEGYRWYTAVGARLSFADDGLTFGTNRDRGVCVHFAEPVPRVIGMKPHSALTVTVADCEGLVEAIGADEPR